MEVSGVRITRKVTDYVSASERIRPLRDQIVLKPLAWEPSKILEVAYWGKTLRGEVLAIGPGCYLIEYQDKVTGLWAREVPATRRCKSRQSNIFRPTDVKCGDIVELGGLELHGYDHPVIQWGDQSVVICREEDVTLVDEGCCCGPLIEPETNIEYHGRGCPQSRARAA